MKKYNITINETLSKTMLVIADSPEEAVEEIESLINREQIVLTADDFTDRSFDIEEV
jgi:hypothetical protein